MLIQDRLAKLRKLMKKNCIGYYYVPHEDENLLENTPSSRKRLEWISGFSGSAGSLLIEENNLNLFIDGRYTIQSKIEMKNVKCKIHNVSNNNFLDFLKKIKNKKKKLGIDIKTISVKNYSAIKKICDEKNIHIVNLDLSLIDIIWKRSLEVQKTNEIFFLKKKYTGIDLKEKKKKLVNYIDNEKVDFLYIENSESVAWLTNIRGKDLDFTPITFCSALINRKYIYLFMEDTNISHTIKKKLGKFTKFLNKSDFSVFLEKNNHKYFKIIMDDKYTSFYNFNVIANMTKNIIFKPDIIQDLKSIKNIQEINCIKKAHIHDGKALCKFLYWFKNKKGNMSELDIVKKIDMLRMKNREYISRSFPTIAGSGPNGAIIHYQPSKKSNRLLKDNDILLLDSGAQYLSGTTDVTRTIIRGKAKKDQILDYTLVLKGHLKINLARFPFGITGNYLDFLARQSLWNNGKDFAHSTGHGVGFCLNVHEGPFSISTKNSHKIANGMVFSNEPGYYKTNCYGIRIENLVTAKSQNLFGKKFIVIENFTLAPYELDLVDKTLLCNEEKNWLNIYHRDVVKKISPLLEENERVWLKKACKEII